LGPIGPWLPPGVSIDLPVLPATSVAPDPNQFVPVGLRVSIDPGDQILATASIPFAGPQNYFPSHLGPYRGPNTVGPHRAAVASNATVPLSLAHPPVGLPVSSDPNQFTPVALPVSPDPGNQVLAAVSIHQHVLGVTSAQPACPFAGSQNYCPSTPGPWPWPNTVGPHREWLPPPPPHHHLWPTSHPITLYLVGLPVSLDPNEFVPVGLPVSPDPVIQVLAAVSTNGPFWVPLQHSRAFLLLVLIIIALHPLAPAPGPTLLDSMGPRLPPLPTHHHL